MAGKKTYYKSEIIIGTAMAILAISGISLGVYGITSTILENAVKLKKEQPTTIETTAETDTLEYLKGNVQLGEEKIFEAGEHYLCVRMPQETGNYSYYNSDNRENIVINEMPEGYKVYSITPYTVKVGKGSATAGYDIWFVNDEKVKVVATYNTDTDTYGYYTFGEVVEKQLTK